LLGCAVMSTFRHLLVATDFGKPAERAVEWAVAFAERFDAKVTLLFVFALSSPYTTPSQHLDALYQEGQRMLDAEAAKLSKRLPMSKSVMRSGSPWEEILAEAKEDGADLIVMGTRGRRGLPRGPIGSVAERVVRMASTPVLTVAAPDDAPSSSAAELRTSAR
jgi:nucleotide-binding universal stress UspA family protein